MYACMYAYSLLTNVRHWHLDLGSRSRTHATMVDFFYDLHLEKRPNSGQARSHVLQECR